MALIIWSNELEKWWHGGCIAEPYGWQLRQSLQWWSIPERSEKKENKQKPESWWKTFVNDTKKIECFIFHGSFSSCCCCCQVTSVVSDSVWPHRRQPTRLPRPWESPGKNTGVGCHFLLQCMKVKSESELTQSRPTLSDPMDCSLPGSSIHGIFQARVLEWVGIAFSITS